MQGTDENWDQPRRWSSWSRRVQILKCVVLYVIACSTTICFVDILFMCSSSFLLINYFLSSVYFTDSISLNPENRRDYRVNVMHK
jgi:hypothetical protein